MVGLCFSYMHERCLRSNQACSMPTEREVIIMHMPTEMVTCWELMSQFVTLKYESICISLYIYHMWYSDACGVWRPAGCFCPVSRWAVHPHTALLKPLARRHSAAASTCAPPPREASQTEGSPWKPNLWCRRQTVDRDTATWSNFSFIIQYNI